MDFGRNCGEEKDEENDARGYAPAPRLKLGTSRIPLGMKSGAKTGPLLAMCVVFNGNLRCNVLCDIIVIYEWLVEMR